MDPKKKYQLFKENKSFCVVPWTNFELFTNGDIKTCSVGHEKLGNINQTDINEILKKGKILQRIKKNMLDGVVDRNCTFCQYRSIDETKFDYLKDHYNSKIINEDIQYDDIENFDLRFIDLHWSNVCNLRCVMCNPKQSSLIAKDEKVKITPVDKKNIKKIIDMVLDKQNLIKEIYLSGGEPMYNPYNLQLLEKISNKDVPIRVNTNMQWDENNKIFKELKKFTNVQLTMSADALFEKFNYIRNGGDWETFSKNLNFIKKTTNFDIRVNTIFSLINAVDIPSVIKYFFFENNIQDITINLVKKPKEIDAKNYPKDKKQSVVENINSLIKDIPKNNKNLINNLKNCVEHIQSPNEHSYIDCLNHITRNHSKKWQLVFTDLI
jgi:radical SAM protein with 4Fe4S-binding SPASM domain